MALVRHFDSQGPPMRYVGFHYIKPQCCSAEVRDVP